MTRRLSWLSIPAVSLLCACGGELPPDENIDDLVSCRSIQWWHGYGITSNRKESYGWWDTDLAVSSSTPIQLRHASKLIAQGTYAWGWMPTFVDQATGRQFRFVHLRPQHKYTTSIGHVYPAGTVVGVSGGNTWDTGGAGRGYSTGPHLCVQTISGFRTSFPDARDKCN